eukprot:7754679-Pyramimonas_sp.AAC.1
MTRGAAPGLCADHLIRHLLDFKCHTRKCWLRAAWGADMRLMQNRQLTKQGMHRYQQVPTPWNKQDPSG